MTVDHNAVAAPIDAPANTARSTAELVEQAELVVGQRRPDVGRRIGRPVGAAVATGVVADDPPAVELAPHVEAAPRVLDRHRRRQPVAPDEGRPGVTGHWGNVANPVSARFAQGAGFDADGGHREERVPTTMLRRMAGHATFMSTSSVWVVRPTSSIPPSVTAKPAASRRRPSVRVERG